MSSASRRLAFSLDNDRADREIADEFPIYIPVFAFLGSLLKISTHCSVEAGRNKHRDRTEKREREQRRIVCEE
jgi:hypothetical protein